ncbi:MAG: cytochrome c biogenesis protein [Flammeovirgaceae bacterium]|nr:cytochrome c biogenesis protein [Flammeovirgaceae bacterium]MDW8287193.1 cytochrome c biogenesis protein CcsA [Flammeovirgaceae bacterium]
MSFRKDWWKYVCILLLVYVLWMGFMAKVPRLAILNETIRNLYFHVTMWFGMVILLAISAVYAVRQLRSPQPKYDIRSAESASVGVLFGILGLVTGMIWAQYTWGSFWSGDPKQKVSAIALMIYLAYFVLRNSFDDAEQKARISAIYNIFAFATYIPLIFVVPRLSDDSLHPGNGGNPGFNAYDLDAKLRIVFYPAVVAWTLLGWWLVDVKTRIALLHLQLQEK